MTGIQSSELSEALVRAYQHWEARHTAQKGQAAPPTTATIAISRETGARGTSVARQLGAQLGWHVYDNELLEQIAREMNVRVSLLESVDERIVPWLEERMEALGAVPFVSETTYYRHLVETILSLGAHGECIVVGRGANFVLPARTTLRVRLIADLPDRIAVMAQELGVSTDEAARHVRDADQKRTRFIKDRFHVDPSDPLNYDLTLNTSRLSVADCAACVLPALHSLQQRLAEKR